MPPTSKKLRGHIGLGLSVQCSEGFSRKIYLGDTELNRIFFIVVVGVQTVSVSLVVGVVDISISWVVGLIPRWIYFWWVS